MIDILMSPYAINLLGRLGENEHRRMLFPISEYAEMYPGAAYALIYHPPGASEGYPVATTSHDERYLYWIVTNTDLAAEGSGLCELIVLVDSVVAKSDIYETRVLTALDGAGTPPPPWEGWQAEFARIKGEAEDAAEAAEDSATAALESAQTATDASGAAVSARNAAQGYASDADGHARDAAGSATAAQGHADTAEQSAEDAQEAAEGAAGSATRAGQSAANAASSAASASADAAAAAESRVDAQTEAAAASESADNARDAAQAAEESASAAAGSAAAAAASEGNAAGSASAAAQSATNAAGSASGAANSATAAAQSATSASGSATAAAGSAAAAAASEAAAREVEESIPEDYTDLSSDVVELKSQINAIIDAAFVETSDTETVTTDITSDLQWNIGYVSNGVIHGAATNYKYVQINDVLPDDVIAAYDGADQIQIRFADQMYGASVVQAQTNQKPLTVLAGVDSVVISIATTYVDKAAFKVKLTRTITTTKISLDMDDVPTEGSSKPATSGGIYNAIINGVAHNSAIVQRVDTFPAYIDAYNTLKRGAKLGASIAFSAFTSIQIGMMRSNGNIDYAITVDDTNVIYTYGDNRSVSAAHGLAIANNIQISVSSNTAGQIEVLVTSDGVSYNKTWVFLNSALSCPFVNFTGTNGSGSFSFVPEDIDKSIWVFGDSYISDNSSRWMYYYLDSPYAENALIAGYSGGESANAITGLRTLLTLGKPKYILWCLGMNDGTDSGSAPPEKWMTSINTVLSLCTQNGITPIFATIPTVPSINNEKKNAYVRSSGYQYVDFAKAVGASASGFWYDGMLYTDNVHPTDKGAKALYAQAITDCPQLCIMP